MFHMRANSRFVRSSAAMLVGLFLLAGCGKKHELHRVQHHIRRAKAVADPRVKIRENRQARRFADQGFLGPPSRETAHCGYILAEMHLMGDPGVKRDLQKARKEARKTVDMLEQLRKTQGGYAAELRDAYGLLEKIHALSGIKAGNAAARARKYGQLAETEGGEGFVVSRQ